MAHAASPTRIAFCITDLDPGGAERALVQIVTRLDRSSWQPAVYCLSRPGELVGVLQKAGISTRCLCARRVTDVRIVFELANALREFNPSILQTFLFHANLVGRMAARQAGVPICVSGIRVADRRAKWRLWLDWLTNWRVATNVCVSHAVMEFSASAGRLPRRKLTVIANGVDVATFAGAQPLDLTPLGIPAGARVLAAVGRLDRQKGLDYLILAAALLMPRYPDLHLLITGDGPERERLLEQVDRLGLSSRIHFTGWRPDVARILRAADGLVLPSLWEGMPNVVLEAMAAGLPVVATAVEGIEELVIPERTGLIVPPRSPEALAGAMEALLTDPQRAAVWGRAAQERAQAEFSWEKTAGEYDALYRRLLARPRRGLIVR